MSEKAGAGDKFDVAVGNPGGDAVQVRGQFDVACYEIVDGKPVQIWKERAQNGVVVGGLGKLLNYGLFNRAGSTDGPYLVLHNATYNSTRGWAEVSGSQVGGYGANWLKATAWSTTNSSATVITFSQSYSFTTSTYTVNGPALCYYTATSAATNPNATDVILYNIGTFSAAQAVQSGNVLSVTGSVIMNTA